jgi:transcriptional regulator with XRE-family HTH domain
MTDAEKLKAMAKAIGKRLQQFREALGLKQKEAAELADVTESHWSEFERGKRRITINTAIRLCEDCGLSLDWIYFGRMAGLPSRLRKILAPDSN